MSAKSIPSPGRFTIEWALLGIALLILGASISFWLYRQHADIRTTQSERLQAQARVVEENLVHQLRGMDGALKGVLDRFPRLEVKQDRAAASRQLRAIKAAMTGVRAVFVLDAEGRLSTATWDKFVPDQDFSHREYFRTPRMRPDPAVLYVSTPFTTIAGVYSINVSRVAVGPGGEFDGLVTATLDPDFFAVLLRSVLYAPDVTTSIAHANGRLFVGQPEGRQTFGKNLDMPNSNFDLFMHGGQTEALMAGIDNATGEQFLSAYRMIKDADLGMDKPLVVTVGRSISAMFAPWRREVMVNAGFFGLFVIVMCVGLYASHRRRDRDHAEKRRAEAALRAREERYRTLFDRASDGIMILSLDGKLVAVNDAFARMHGYTPAEMLAMDLKSLDTPDTYRKLPSIMKRIVAGESLTFEVEHYHKDGHVFPLEVSSSMIASDDGHVVQAFHRDITERNRQRDLLAQHNALLTKQKAELEATLGRIKRLEGLISICMYCKKMRTESNAWLELEHNISEHSDAMFSHGLCPDCYEEQKRRIG